MTNKPVRIKANGHDVTNQMPLTVAALERLRPAKPAKLFRPKLMLDSGAYSAWKRGVHVDLEQYMDYIDRNHDLLHSYVNLDVIPGAPGRASSQDEVEAAAKASYKNHRRMRKAGFNPMPVFHYGESFDWLHRLLDDGEPYIGIGGMGNTTATTQVDFLDRVFTVITDRAGLPTVRTHGLGVASFDLLRRYPFSTADATSWMMTAAMGGMYVPVSQRNEFDYAQPPAKLTMSEVDRAKGVPPDHFLRYGPLMKERVQKYLDEVGVTLEQVVGSYEARASATVHFMLRFQDAIGPRPFRHRVRGLIEHAGEGPELTARTLKPVRLIFAGEGEWLVRVLVGQGATRWLRSYFALQNNTEALLGKYLPLVPNRMPKTKRKSK